MVPEIFFRVTHQTNHPPTEITKNYRFTPALLPGYSRRRVQYADYPGILPCANSSVLGGIVTGLTDRDVKFLDRFEGEGVLYKREEVTVNVLGPEVIKGDGGTDDDRLREERLKIMTGEGEERCVETYVFLDTKDLEGGEWSYEEFRKSKMSSWVFQKDEEYAEAWEGFGRIQGDDEEEADVHGSEDDKEEDSDGSEEETEEVRTKRIVSVVAGIAAEEDIEREEAEKVVKAAV